MGRLRTCGAAFAAAALFALGLVGACSEAPKAVGEGGACAVTTDCDRGLVCVPQRKGGRICTSDLSAIDQTPQRPADAAADTGEGGEGGDAPSDAPITSDAPVEDTSTPPVDAASE